jgi:hypothetical protein
MKQYEIKNMQDKEKEEDERLSHFYSPILFILCALNVSRLEDTLLQLLESFFYFVLLTVSLKIVQHRFLIVPFETQIQFDVLLINR